MNLGDIILFSAIAFFLLGFLVNVISANFIVTSRVYGTYGEGCEDLRFVRTANPRIMQGMTEWQRVTKVLGPVWKKKGQSMYDFPNMFLPE